MDPDNLKRGIPVKKGVQSNFWQFLCNFLQIFGKKGVLTTGTPPLLDPPMNI